MKSTKKKADLLLQDFITRANHPHKIEQAVRKTLHYSQATMAQKMHYCSIYVSDFENDVPLKPSVQEGIWKCVHEINYELYAKLSDQDFILYCIRVVSNYGSACHDSELYDEELIQKFLESLAKLYPKYAD